MSQFVLLGLILILQITAVVQLIHRLFLVIRTPKYGGKLWKTASAEMRAWRFSAVEPIVTTILTIPSLLIGFFLFFELQSPAVLSVLYVVPLLSMMVYSWRINKHGEGGRLARLAMTVIGTRTLLLSTSAFFLLRHANTLLHGEPPIFPYWAVIIPVVCAFFIRATFTVHQNLVIDKMDVDAATSSERSQRRITLIEDNELWDEQVALIEQLKSEEEMSSYEV